MPTDFSTYPQTNPDAGQGHPGHLTLEQEQKLIEFRKRLEEAGYTERLDDPSLLRFLRARKFDVDKAYIMFTECEQWREDWNVDEIGRSFVFEEKPLVTVYYPQYYHKNDKDGRPVYIEQLGKIDITAMYKITTQERLLKNLVHEYEKFVDPRLPACSRKAGKLIETSCTILDLQGVGLRAATQVYGYLQEASKIGQNYYPERMGKFYLINAPWGFATVWNVIKRWLDPVTVAKISILGSNYQPALLAQIPPENLPFQFGGTCRCPGGCELSDEGPWQDPQWLGPGEKPAREASKDRSAEQKESTTEHAIPVANTETRGTTDDAAIHAV